MKRILLIITAFAAMTSCQKSLIERSSDSGSLTLNLKNDPIVEVVTKNTTDVPVDNFNVYINKDNQVYRQYKYSAMTAPIAVPAATYTVSADNYTVTEALSANNGWGDVRYYGISEAKAVNTGQNTDYQVTCRVANTAVSVIFDPSVANYFEQGFKLTAYTDVNRKLTYELASGTTSGTVANVGYFESGNSLLYQFVGTYKGDTVKKEIVGTIPEEKLAAATHLYLTFKVNNLEGTLKPTITVITECQSLYETITVDPTGNGSIVPDSNDNSN